jgi:serine/tyrosine/threonine adenylyltransferase
VGSKASQRYGAGVPELHLDDSFARALPGLYEPWQAAEFPAHTLLVLNERLAAELGADPAALRTPERVAALAGQRLFDGSRPVAQAYAGHQFGGYSPRLGDGRALLLGEIVDPTGRRRDLHLKGSGRTPFARGGDGKAAVGPMLREYVISEAMHALGIPTTRSLAVVATGEKIARETPLPGAVLTRVAASHLRVGTFQYAAAAQSDDLLPRLAAYAIERHHPAAVEAENPYLAFYTAVLEAQASLVAQWMLVGFIHGVMNTDNMTISGETIDYGPCAFMDRYHPGTVFSSIDHGGRYAYANQPRIAQWNLARLAETLLPFFGETEERAVEVATEVLQSFTQRFDSHWSAGMRAKLGLASAPDDTALVPDLLELLDAQAVDFTSFFRALASLVRGNEGPVRSLFTEPDAFDEWAARWAMARGGDPRPDTEVADAMDRVNPVYIPRNHLVEAALSAATEGDMAPFERLVDVVSRPFEQRPFLLEYSLPAPPDGARYRTFCGT